MFDIEAWLSKISAKNFFVTIGLVVGTGILSAIALVILCIVLNFNLLNWME